MSPRRDRRNVLDDLLAILASSPGPRFTSPIAPPSPETALISPGRAANPENDPEVPRPDFRASSADSPVAAAPPTEDLTSRASTIVNAAMKAGFTGDALKTIVSIALAESGGDPRANLRSNVEDSRGLTQINAMAHRQYDPNALYDPDYNLRAAMEVSGGGTNWKPWSVYTSGKYQQFLPVAEMATKLAAGQQRKTQISEELAKLQAQRASLETPPPSPLPVITGFGTPAPPPRQNPSTWTSRRRYSKIRPHF